MSLLGSEVFHELSVYGIIYFNYGIIFLSDRRKYLWETKGKLQGVWG